MKTSPDGSINMSMAEFTAMASGTLSGYMGAGFKPVVSDDYRHVRLEAPFMEW
jgi:hypothetical protein